MLRSDRLAARRHTIWAQHRRYGSLGLVGAAALLVLMVTAVAAADLPYSGGNHGSKTVHVVFSNHVVRHLHCCGICVLCRCHRRKRRLARCAESVLDVRDHIHLATPKICLINSESVRVWYHWHQCKFSVETHVSKQKMLDCHVQDIGFDGIDPQLGTDDNVINKYFDEYFPRAVRTNAWAYPHSGMLGGTSPVAEPPLFSDCLALCHERLFIQAAPDSTHKLLLLFCLAQIRTAEELWSSGDQGAYIWTTQVRIRACMLLVSTASLQFEMDACITQLSAKGITAFVWTTIQHAQLTEAACTSERHWRG